MARKVELEEVTPGVIRSGGRGHPILGLLHRGEQRWLDKLSRQSQTVEEAALVYQAKWNRPPPKGFDQWYVLHARGLLQLLRD